MLRLRKKQADKFRETMLKNFENRMVVHLKKFFPKHYEALEEDNTRELIRYGIDRAGRHQIVTERDVCKYIDLMVAFGPEFDEDPDHSWAVPILRDDSLNYPGGKIDALFEAGVDHLRQSPNFKPHGDA